MSAPDAQRADETADAQATELVSLQRRVIELLDELRRSNVALQHLRDDAADAEETIDQERRRHRLAYETLLEHNAHLRTKVVADEKRLRRLGRQVESLRAKNEAMQAKFNAVKRFLPGPLRDMAQKYGRRVAGQDDQA